jgi:cysteine desulfuration protein SufE
MASAAFEEIAETFDFLPDWEERYAHVIALGKAMPPLEDAFKVPATKVQGCASQVWLMTKWTDGRAVFRGDSDALIVKGLVAIIIALYSGLTAPEILKVDAPRELGRLGLDQHLSSQRSNGLRAMVARIRQIATEAQVLTTSDPARASDSSR